MRTDRSARVQFPMLVQATSPGPIRGEEFRFAPTASQGVWTKDVAQVSNLLYRRPPAGSLSYAVTPADWKSAIQQVGNLRYAFYAHPLTASDRLK